MSKTHPGETLSVTHTGRFYVSGLLVCFSGFGQGPRFNGGAEVSPPRLSLALVAASTVSRRDTIPEAET